MKKYAKAANSGLPMMIAIYSLAKYKSISAFGFTNDQHFEF
jgi:hypothetical protein